MNDRTSIVVSVLGMSAIGVAGVVALEIGQGQIDRNLAVQIFGFLGTMTLSLIGYLKSAGNAAAIQQVTDKVEVMPAKVAEKAAVVAADLAKSLPPVDGPVGSVEKPLVIELTRDSVGRVKP